MQTGSLRERTESRSKWGNSMEFLLSCIGYSVGLGNVWRFPYLAYKHGGAAFLLAYLTLQLTIGKPLYFMELAMAQYSAHGPVQVWDAQPAGRGIGFAQIMVSLCVSLYYNIIIAYVCLFFFSSFTEDLPWTICKKGKAWRGCFTDRSVVAIKPCSFDMVGQNLTRPCICTGNYDIDSLFAYSPKPCSVTPRHASEIFFNHEVIGYSANLSDFGTVNWKLALNLLLAWVIVLACMIKGIQSTGKVVYFTALFPYVVLLILLVRGLTLDGALDGIKFFVIPTWSKLIDAQMWIDAAGQMFFSLSLAMGGILMFGSYNLFHHKIYMDTVIISSMDLITSIISGFVIFSTFGYMAKLIQKDVKDVAKSGYGLAFVAYPEILSTLALPQLWSVLFFFMLFTLGLDSEFALLETVTSYMIDDFVWCRRNKIKLRIGLAVILYCLGLALICPGGQYLIDILDSFGASYSLCLICCLETISIMWIYGMFRFLGDIEYMLGKKPSFLPFWYFTWSFWSPLALGFLTVMIYYGVSMPVYLDGTKAGFAVKFLCWAVHLAVMSPVVIWFFIWSSAVLKRKGFHSFPTFWHNLTMSLDRWGPADGTMPHRVNKSLWLDVCDWDCFKRHDVDSNEDLEDRTDRTDLASLHHTAPEVKQVAAGLVGMGRKGSTPIDLPAVVSTSTYSSKSTAPSARGTTYSTGARA